MVAGRGTGAQELESNEPVLYDPNDPDDGPHELNDEATSQA